MAAAECADQEELGEQCDSVAVGAVAGFWGGVGAGAGAGDSVGGGEERGVTPRSAEGERRCRLEDTWQMGRAGGLLTEDLEPIGRVLGQQLGNEAFNVWLEQLAHLLPFGFAPIADEFGENFGIA